MYKFCRKNLFGVAVQFSELFMSSFHFWAYLRTCSLFVCWPINGDLVRKFIMYILPKQKNCLLASKPQTYFWSLLLSLWKITCANMRADDKCSFCESEPETLPRFFFHCVYSQLFWKQFESYYYSLTKEFFHLTLQDVLIGIITSKCPLLNYLLLIAKVYLWDCRRSETLPNITGFKLKVKNKYETEKYICIKNNTIEKFTRKWAITSGSVLL